MSFTVIGQHQKDKRALREGYVDTLSHLMEQDPAVVHVDCDLFNCIGVAKLHKQYPDRVINAGIAEANGMGVAAGLAATGKKVFFHSFGCFASRRAFDQAFLSVGYSQLPVRILGSDPGVSAAYNGGTHMPFEDGALYLSIPGATVIDVCDYAQAASVFRQIVDRPGLTYVRIVRKGFVTVYEDGSEFTVGRGAVLRPGTDVTVFASGIMVDEALRAQETLREQGVSARIVDLFTWKPLDEPLILQCAQETGAVVTAENHNVTCGLGSAVASLLARKRPTPMEMVGVEDRFGQVGPVPFLQEEYGLTAAHIVQAAQAVLNRK